MLKLKLFLNPFFFKVKRELVKRTAPASPKIEFLPEQDIFHIAEHILQGLAEHVGIPEVD